MTDEGDLEKAFGVDGELVEPFAADAATNGRDGPLQAFDRLIAKYLRLKLVASRGSNKVGETKVILQVVVGNGVVQAALTLAA